MNRTVFCGTLVESDGYTAFSIITKRNNGAEDTLRLEVPKSKIEELKFGDYVVVLGKIKTKKIYSELENKEKVIVYVDALDVKLMSEDGLSTIISKTELSGYVCGIKPIRKTPESQKSIIDFYISVNDSGKTYYIPTIAWNEDAEAISKLEKGTKIRTTGKLFSRVFYKQVSENSFIPHTAYEYSIFGFDVINSDKKDY